MNVKNDKALAGIDMAIAVIAIIIFTTLIIALMCNNAMESVKIAKETMAMVYITEIFENIGIAEFDDVIESKVDDFIPNNINNNYDVELVISDISNNAEEHNILKRVNLTLTYDIGNKTYSYSAERLKSKE